MSLRSFSSTRRGHRAGRVFWSLGIGLLALPAWQGWNAGDSQAALATLWSLCATR